MIKRKYLFLIIIWGSMWGIAESTIGYVLHNLPLNIGYMVWFPMAYFFINGVYKETGKCQSVLHIAFLAALIKTVNLLMPVRIDRVINPIVSIILEGIIVYSLFLVTKKREESGFIYMKSLYISVGWRLMYLCYLLFVPYWMYAISPLADSNKLMTFVIYESLINSLIIYTIHNIYSLWDNFKIKKIKLSLNNNFYAYLAVILLTTNILLYWVL